MNDIRGTFEPKELDGVRSGDDPAFITKEDDRRLYVTAYNQGGHDCTGVDLGDLLVWLDKNPDITKEAIVGALEPSRPEAEKLAAAIWEALEESNPDAAVSFHPKEMAGTGLESSIGGDFDLLDVAERVLKKLEAYRIG